MYTIYCHVFPNGKRYVGITKTSLESRWDNGNGYKTCPLVDRAIQKYGWENVAHEILDTAKTKREAESKEREYIKKYNSTDNRFGYNILPGGDVATNELTDDMRYKLGKGWRGKHRTEEEKKRIGDSVRKKFERDESNGHFGLKHSDSAKRKMSKSQKALWNDERREEARKRMEKRMSDPEYRKKIIDNLRKYPPKPHKLTDEEKELRRKTMTGKWIGEKSPCSIPVLQFTKDGEFVKRWANAGEAERAGIALRSNIGKCCNHSPHVYSAGGFVWKYEKDCD